MLNQKYIYWISTVILFSMLIFIGVLYVVYYDMLVDYFILYGYPIYIIYPLAFFAHYMINEFDPFPTMSLILLFSSYFTGRKVRP